MGLTRMTRMTRMTRTFLYLFSFSIFVYGGYSKSYLIETDDDNIANEDEVKDGITPPQQWKWTIYEELRAYLAKDGVDFETASAFCEEEGGRLPRVMSQGEEKEVKNFMTVLGGSGKTVWIGLHSRFRQGSWQHPNTSKSAKYFNFGEGGNADGKCAAMTSIEAEKWMKMDCKSKLMDGIICQKDSEVKRDSNCSKKYDSQDRWVLLKNGAEKNEKFCEEIHPDYVPNHICINDTVDYTGHGPIPTHGPHRPN